MSLYPQHILTFINENYEQRPDVLTRRFPDICSECRNVAMFMPQDVNFREVMYLIYHNITERPTCKHPTCSKYVKFITKDKGFADFCSKQCMCDDPATKQRRKLTNIDKYGGIAPIHSQIVKDKARQTNIERHGVDNVLKSTPIRERVKRTWMDKYGVDNPSKSAVVSAKISQSITKTLHENPEVAEQRKKTMIDKYGVDNPSKSKHIRAQANQTNLMRYGHENPMKNGDVRKKQMQTTVSKYGDHVSRRHIPQTSLDRLNCARWLRYVHLHLQNTLATISYMLGVDASTVAKYCDMHGIQTVRFPFSQGEREISEFLKNHNIDHDLNTKHIIPPYELDIYLPQHQIAIEYCGLYWHSDIHDRIDNQYHKRKHDLCKSAGIRLLTIFEDEWRDRCLIVKKIILHLCGLDQQHTIYARKCNIKPVNTTTKVEFFETNHIQGDGPSSINYGLFYDDTLVACLGLFQKFEGTFCLNRYATSTKVLGGFTKLLNYFKQHHEWQQIITFADLRWSDGNLYHSSGFSLDKIIPPDYCYSPDAVTRIHKFNYRRKYLAEKLEFFDPNLSERVNCDNNMVYRIWDCGKMRFILNNQ